MNEWMKLITNILNGNYGTKPFYQWSVGKTNDLMIMDQNYNEKWRFNIENFRKYEKQEKEKKFNHSKQEKKRHDKHMET